MTDPLPSRGINACMPNIIPPPQEAEVWCHTNACPPRTTVQRYASALGNIREHHRQIARDISERVLELVALRNQDKLLQTYMKTYEKILNPVRYLPDVVLREIFRLCVDGMDSQSSRIPNLLGDPSHQNSLHPSAAPWTLSQVCHRWRDIALSCTSLWSRIALVCGSGGFVRTGPGLNQLILQLQRSGNCPLAVYIQSFRLPLYPVDNPLVLGPHPHPLSPLLISLSTHSNRWETLHISISSCLDFQLVHKLITMVKGNIPVLSHLSLHIRCSVPTFVPSGQPLVIDGFAFAPKLRTFSFWGATDPSRCLQLPWDQVTDFRVHWTNTGHDYIQTILRMSKLKIWVHIGAFDPPNPPLPFVQLQVVQAQPTLEHLHKLWLFPAYSTGTTRSLLNVLTVPNLRTLCLGKDSNKLLGINAFLARVAPTLRSLCVDLDGLTRVDVERILSSMPGLRSLHVSSVREGFIVAMGSTLAEDKETPCLVPGLRELGIFFPYEFTGNTLLQMVKLRLGCTGSGSRARHSQLRKLLYADPRHHIDEITERQLHLLRSDTFEVDGTAKHWSAFL
ncbi:hypothetical protein VNI00_002207 [Paramarasmius palmivorus]|uniref:F-box domain-containing protein n=1 Tax=Paramarasmius palmivorus TaxID=297713 RepID=A0AAW0E0F2_9AGAR